MTTERPYSLEDFNNLRPLGRGNSSDVFAAESPTGLPVAIKLLRPKHQMRRGAVRRATERLRREASVLASMSHPNLLPLLGWGVSAEQRPFLVLPRLEGRTLRSHLDVHGALPPSEAVRIAIELLDALVEAHSLGVVHRDIKPSNVFLASDLAWHGEHTRTVLFDFGIAHVDGEEPLTGPDCIVGTPAYLAPEQAVGDLVDERADLYSVGLTMLEALTGHAPYRHLPPYDALKAHLTREPTGLEVVTQLLPGLGSVLSRALAKSKADRWPTARSMRAALLNWRARQSRLPRPLPARAQAMPRTIFGQSAC